MKKITLLTVFTMLSLVASAQSVSTLSEDFNVSCVSPAAFPSSDGWTFFNPLSSTMPLGEWQCTAINGRPTTTGSSTPGLFCSGTYNGAYHLDTSYFITPSLNISHDVGHVYLQFDTKTEDIILGGKLTAGSFDTTTLATHSSYNLLSITPAFSVNDSSGWVTHQVDITNYIDSPSFYLAFRYVSTNSAGTAWFLDNINFTTEKLNVAKVNKGVLPLTVIGKSSSSQIALSYSLAESGMYHIAVYDMVGRRVYDGQIAGQTGTASYTIDGLDLRPGMYCVKMGNENTYGTAKVMIQ